MDTKKLRQKILDLAIHGKLVPQDPNDEPASVLLERIRAEKERLVKEGKIKKSKASKTSDTPHYENVPFEVPEGWCWSTIDEVAESNIGLTYKPSDICENGVPVYRSNNIQNRRICLNELVRVSATILPKQYLQEGDLLICARNGSRNLVGKCAIIEKLNEPTSFGAFMAVCRSVLTPWIFHVLNSNYFNKYLDDSNSTAINQVTQKMLLAFKIPVPPLVEQKRIILQLQHWFTLIDQIEQGKADLQTVIKQTKSKILDLAIHGKLVPQDPNDEPASELLKRINPKSEITCDNGHYGKIPFEQPSSWVWCRLGDVVSIKSGDSISVRNNQDGKYPIYGGNGINGYYCDNNVETGTIIIGRVGFYCGSVHMTESKAWVTDNAFIVCYKNVFNPIYLSYLLRWLQLNKTSNSTAQPVISGKGIYPLLIPIPPITEQQRIVDAIDNINSKLDAIMENL